MAKSLVISHRGANRYAPQNTLPAFQKGYELGADGFETDVHITKDGRLYFVTTIQLMKLQTVAVRLQRKLSLTLRNTTSVSISLKSSEVQKFPQSTNSFHL